MWSITVIITDKKKIIKKSPARCITASMHGLVAAYL